jgi:integrase
MKKAEKPNQGRIFLRGKVWWLALCVNGKEQRESTQTTDEQKAVKQWTARVKELNAHQINPTTTFLIQRDRRRTIADLVDALEADFRIRGIASAQNVSNLKRVREDFGHYRATALTSDQIDQYVQGRLTEGNAHASINRTLQLLKQSYTLAKLPAPDVRRLDESGNVRRGFFSEQEIRKVIAGLSQPLADFVLFAWLTGMRKSEIASLSWQDLDGEVIRLRAESAKNGKSRSLPLEGELSELIARRKLARQYKANGAVILSGLIFHRAGEPVREFRKSWASACKKAGVRRLFHDLRRSAVRNMVAAGVPQTVAMRISGHETPSMFQRYAIASETDLRTALRATQNYLATAKENVVAMAGNG